MNELVATKLAGFGGGFVLENEPKIAAHDRKYQWHLRGQFFGLF
jgi:hypothetical protein